MLKLSKIFGSSVHSQSKPRVVVAMGGAGAVLMALLVPGAHPASATSTSVAAAEHAATAPTEASGVWELDGNAKESGGADRHGTALSGVTFTEGSAVFSGRDDSEITIPWDLELEPGGSSWELKVEGIVPGALTGVHQSIAGSRSTSAQGWTLYIMPSGELSYWTRVVGQASWKQHPTGVFVETGSTYDVVATRTTDELIVKVSGAGTSNKTYPVPPVPIPNDGSNPIRIGNGGDFGEIFYYRGSIDRVEIRSVPPVRPCTAASEPDHTIADIDWASFTASYPTDEVSGLSLDVANNAARYLMSTWWDKTFLSEPTGERPLSAIMPPGDAETTYRSVGMAAVNIATLVATGTFDEAEIGVSEDVAVERVRNVLRAAALEHEGVLAGGWGPEGPHGAMGRDWQASLWAYLLGFSTWLLGDRIDDGTQACVARMVAYEADNMPDPEYYRDAAGTILKPGDTMAEEESWRSSLMGLASAMLPDAPGRDAWLQDSIERSVIAWSTPDDVDSDEKVNGKLLSSVLQGSNIENDGTVENHDLMHPLYMLAFDQSVNNVMSMQLAGQAAPRGYLHNIDLTYKALVDQEFSSPPWQAPGGTIYTPGSADIYYPEGNDWGTSFPMYFAQADVIVDAFDLDAEVSTPGSEWAELHLEASLAMQSRHEDGHTYVAGNSESNYKLKEERVAQIAGLTVLTRWLSAQSGACLTDRSYTTSESDSVLGELETLRALSDKVSADGNVDKELADRLSIVIDDVESARRAGDTAAADSSLRRLQLVLVELDTQIGDGEPLRESLGQAVRAIDNVVGCIAPLVPQLVASAEVESMGTVSIELTGHTAGAVDIDLVGPDGQSRSIARALPTVGGALLSAFPLPAATRAGDYIVRVTTPTTQLEAPMRVVEDVSPKVSLSATKATRGDSVDVSVSAMAGNSVVVIELHSAVVELGAITTDSEGSASVSVKIPLDAMPGMHEIVVTDSEGARAAASIEVVAESSVGDGSSSGAGDKGDLAGTGADLPWWAVIAGIGALCLGGLALMFRRRGGRQSAE